MDPLSALRDFTVRGELDKISQSSDEIRFAGDYSFPPTAETAFRSKQGNLYTLETLLHFILNHHLKHTDYLQSARSRRVPAVTLPDRKPLLDYLTGKISSSESIIQFLPSAPAATAADVEEYRPDDPSLPAFADPAVDADVAGAAAAGAPLPDPDPGVDYVSMIRAMERPLKDRESLLDCRNRNFLELLTASTKREEERQRVESQQRKDGIVAKTRLTSSNPHHRGDETPKPKMSVSVGKIGEGVPIILVPSAFQTLITMYNVKEFLEDGVFVPTDVKVKSMRGGAAAKPECVTVQKKLGSRDRLVTAYEVRDKTSSFKDEEWDRVVAVFVLGKEWQFKEWRSKDPVEIFNKVIGFFVRFEDDSVESVKTVKQWNVKIISISKNKRHQDRTAALEVWDRLEAFMRSRSRS